MRKADANKIFNQMWAEKETWVPNWREIAEYEAPTCGVFDDETRYDKHKKIDHKKLLDSWAVYCLSVLASGMMSGLTSPSRRWFELELAGADAPEGSEAARWLDAVRERMERAFDMSNVYNALHRFYLEVAAFGTAAFMLEEDRQTVFRATVFTIGEYALDSDGTGRINRFARKFRLTASQIKDKFGEENLPQSIKDDLREKRYNKQYVVYHLITPNDKLEMDKKDVRGKAFLSLYWTDGQEEEFLRLAGYEEFPVIAARWEVKNATDTYGKAPGWTCLGDVKTLQKMQKSKLVALDKATNPPLMVSANVQGPVNVQPGGLTRYSGTTDAGIKPVYQVAVDLASLQDGIERTRQSISEVFYVNVFLMLAQDDKTGRTATEITAREQEKMMVMGPALQRLKEEELDPLINRAFNILLRLNALPEPPQELQGMDIQVKYVSVIAQAQRLGEVTAIERGVSFAANLGTVQAQLAGAEVLDGLDFDGALREGLKALGVPADMVRGPEQMQAMRAQRAQQMQAMQQGQAMAEMVQGAKTLSETKMGTGSALDELTGTPVREEAAA